MSVKKQVQEVVTPMRKPSYPGMMMTLDGDGPDYLIRCCCGEQFVVDGAGGDNLVVLPTGPEYRECCPNCQIVGGMTAIDHYYALREIRDTIRSLPHGKFPSFCNWVAAQFEHINDLMDNAIDSMTDEEKRTSLRADAAQLVQVLNENLEIPPRAFGMNAALLNAGFDSAPSPSQLFAQHVPTQLRMLTSASTGRPISSLDPGPVLPQPCSQESQAFGAGRVNLRFEKLARYERGR